MSWPGVGGERRGRLHSMMSRKQENENGSGGMRNDSVPSLEEGKNWLVKSRCRRPRATCTMSPALTLAASRRTLHSAILRERSSSQLLG